MINNLIKVIYPINILLMVHIYNYKCIRERLVYNTIPTLIPVSNLPQLKTWRIIVKLHNL